MFLTVFIILFVQADLWQQKNEIFKTHFIIKTDGGNSRRLSFTFCSYFLTVITEKTYYEIMNKVLKKFFHFTNKSLPTFRNFAQIKTTMSQDFVYFYKNVSTLLTSTLLCSIIIVSKEDTPQLKGLDFDERINQWKYHTH